MHNSEHTQATEVAAGTLGIPTWESWVGVCLVWDQLVIVMWFTVISMHLLYHLHNATVPGATGHIPIVMPSLAFSIYVSSFPHKPLLKQSMLKEGWMYLNLSFYRKLELQYKYASRSMQPK